MLVDDSHKLGGLDPIVGVNLVEGVSRDCTEFPGLLKVEKNHHPGKILGILRDL